VRLIRPAWENSERYRALATPSVEMIRSRQREHEHILATCAAGDAEAAAEALRAHLQKTEKLVTDQLAAPAPAPAAP
jgi:DNA-binding GntR family transcriptional regulator